MMTEIYYFNKTNSNSEVRPGLNLLITAGIHGNEIGTVKLAYNLVHHFMSFTSTNYQDSYSVGSKQPYGVFQVDIDEENDIWNEFPGFNQIVIMPCCNTEGVRAKTKEVPVNVFNDLGAGWQADQDLRQTIYNHIMQADILVDMHSLEGNVANCIMMDTGNSGYWSQTLGKLKELNITMPYFMCGTENGSIARYASTWYKKLPFTWIQKGYNKIYPKVNEAAMNTLKTFFKNVAEVYNAIYSETNTPMPLPWEIGKTLSSNFEGIVVPSSNIDSTIYDGCVIEAGQIICTVETLDGMNSETFRADKKCRIIKLNSGQYIGVGEQVAIIQSL